MIERMRLFQQLFKLARDTHVLSRLGQGWARLRRFLQDMRWAIIVPGPPEIQWLVLLADVNHSLPK